MVNIEYYMNVEPIINNAVKYNTPFSILNNGEYYKHPAIKTPYPIVHLEDIEIHCIHDSMENAIEKFTRRRERMLNVMKHDHVLICTMSIGEFFNNHDNIGELINEFTSCINNLFIGPEKYNNDKINYITNQQYNLKLNKRNSSQVIIGNNQPLSGQLFTKYITDKIL